MSYQTLIVESPSAGVTLIRLNRPEALNALNSQLLGELSDALDTAEADEAVALIRLNRPEALNALNTKLLDELCQALDAAEADEAVRCLVLTGSERAFAAGADIKEMSDKSYAQMFASNFFGAAGQRVERFRKPIIAAVSGFALGGGCELAMLCDFIIASETAKFS